MADLGQSLFLSACLHRDDDCHALLNVEDVLVGLALGRDLFLVRVAMQVENRERGRRCSAGASASRERSGCPDSRDW